LKSLAILPGRGSGARCRDARLAAIATIAAFTETRQSGHCAATDALYFLLRVGVLQGGKQMTLHTETSAERMHLVGLNKNACPQCCRLLLAPEWSEYLSERCVRHAWSCDACGYEFETSVYFAK
jgi:hypothetical protein